jgi:hypothetical protein
MFILDNYSPGKIDDVPYCLPIECGNRLPLGDVKSCSLPEDNTTSCYYKVPEVVCTEQGQCVPVCGNFIFIKRKM